MRHWLLCNSGERIKHEVSLVSLLFSAMAVAQVTAELDARLALSKAPPKSAQSAGDNAWMLVSSALVLMMTGPGLALFYGGLVRKKNVLGTMMQSFILMAVITVLWALVGYSLAFGEGSTVLRRPPLRFPARRRRGAECRLRRHHSTADVHGVPVDVRHHHSGADLRRFRRADEVQRDAAVYGAVGAHRLLPDGAHGVGKGRAAERVPGRQIPCLDFAGGTVVHITSGVSALVCALYLGKRVGYPHEPMRPHSMVLSVIGACLLWVGWFGFNAGSALAASGLATSAFVATHFGAAAATLGWTLAEWIRTGKPSVLGAISGCVAGLVAITPASGFVRAVARAADRFHRRRRMLLHGHAGETRSSDMTIPWTHSACTARVERWARF